MISAADAELPQAVWRATALLAADALVTAAFEVLAHAKCSAESRIEAVQLLAKGGGDRGMLYGQELDKHF